MAKSLIARDGVGGNVTGKEDGQTYVTCNGVALETCDVVLTRMVVTPSRSLVHMRDGSK